jgi:HPr kinase/phosphorylase
MINRVTAKDLLEDTEHGLELTLLAGSEGSSRKIESPRVQKPGLALAGYVESINPHRVQILGNTELTYLMRLTPKELRQAVRRFFNMRLSAVIITNGQDLPAEVIEEADSSQTMLFLSALPTSSCIARVQNCLEETLQVATSVHGVLVDVLGVGVLLLGHSGIGKSETALDLVLRGHRLVADDIVEIKSKGTDSVYGAGSELIKHHMEIRGLGIINIKDMFGVASVRERKKIEIVIELVEWDENAEYERLGIDEEQYEILDVRVPRLTVPVKPGRNMAAIVEVAARNQLLKLQGHHAARNFQERLTREIERREREATEVGDDIE